MHRLFSVGLGCLFVFSMAGVGAADEAAEFMKYYSWWDGSWDVEMQDGGESSKFQMEITKHEPNCHIVSGGGISLWGYDPKRKKWVGTGFNKDGGFTTTVLQPHDGGSIKPGAVNRATVTVKNPDGKVVKGEETWSYIDEDTCKTVGKTTTAEGETSTYEYTCKRRKL